MAFKFTRYFLPTLVALSGVTSTTPPIFGPLLPPPNLPSSSHFTAVTTNLTHLLTTALTNDSTAGFPINTTSFSVAVTSLHAPADRPVLWEHHHLATNRSNHSTAALDGSSPYLLASISKVFTALLTLQQQQQEASGTARILRLDAPTTDFLPELAAAGTTSSSNNSSNSSNTNTNNDGGGGNTNSPIPWHHITIASLLTHLGGIPQTYGFPELAALIPTFEGLGFPPLDLDASGGGDFPPCGVIGLNDGCTASTLLPALADQRVVPVLKPQTSPVYGTLSFALLGLVLERVNNGTTTGGDDGKGYAQLLRERVLAPLGMRGVGVSGEEGVGGEGVAVVPVGEGSWGSEFGINAPASGVVGGSDDLSRLLRAVLRGDEALGLGEVGAREWLKPRAFTPVEGGAVGAPWEVYRVPRGVLTAGERGQGVEVYAKDGSVLGYYSRVMLVPAFGVGVTVLTATEVGETRGLNAVSEAVLAAVVRGAEEAGRLEAEEKYSGEYLAEGRGVDGNVTLSVDQGPGLRVEGLFRNGSDILAAIQGLFEQSVVGGAALSDEWRIYPTGIENRVEEDGKVVVLEDWRMGFETVPAEMDGLLATAGKGVFKDADSSWLRIDGSMAYGGRPVDRFVFVKEEDGQVRSVRLPALRIEMAKEAI